jgi:sugar phosphate isomerase/epimerase
MKAGGREAPYMYFSTLHWKPIANGYSSFLPPSYVRLSAAMGRRLPSAEALDLAADMGVSHAVVHSDRLGTPESVREWEQAMADRLELVRAFGADRVYRIKAPPAGR